MTPTRSLIRISRVEPYCVVDKILTCSKYLCVLLCLFNETKVKMESNANIYIRHFVAIFYLSIPKCQLRTKGLMSSVKTSRLLIGLINDVFQAIKTVEKLMFICMQNKKKLCIKSLIKHSHRIT